MKTLIIALITLSLLVGVPTTTTVEAQSVCTGGTWTTEDLAGTYVSQPSLMALRIQPCGLFDLAWDNQNGRHLATYIAVKRTPKGGVVANGLMIQQGGWFLDNGHTIAVTPAEPGFIKILTYDLVTQEVRAYRLEKIR